VIGILAKGAKKLKSRFRSFASIFTHAHFYINYRQGHLSVLTDVKLVADNSNLILDLSKAAYASYICELTYKVFEKDVAYPGYFGLLDSIIEKINGDFDPKIITMIYELKLLDHLGVKPNLDSCTSCGTTKTIVTFDARSGGFICQNCIEPYMKRVSLKAIKVLRQLAYVDVTKLNSISLNVNTTKELRFFIDDYYDSHAGFYLKSKKFLRDIDKLDL
jgi:DNA repair protein RecO (recombination protein O)